MLSASKIEAPPLSDGGFACGPLLRRGKRAHLEVGTERAVNERVASLSPRSHDRYGRRGRLCPRGPRPPAPGVHPPCMPKPLWPWTPLTLGPWTPPTPKAFTHLPRPQDPLPPDPCTPSPHAHLSPKPPGPCAPLGSLLQTPPPFDLYTHTHAHHRETLPSPSRSLCPLNPSTPGPLYPLTPSSPPLCP